MNRWKLALKILYKGERYFNSYLLKLNDFQKCELALNPYSIEQKKALERQKYGIYARGKFKVLGKTTEIVGKHFGLSRTTFQRGLFIINYGSPSLKKEVREGRKAIFPAYRELKNKLKK